MKETSFRKFWRKSPYNRGSSRTRNYGLQSRRERRISAKTLYKIMGKQ